MKKSILIIGCILLLFCCINITVRYDIYTNSGAAFYDARILQETENTITVVSDDGITVEMSKFGLKIVRKIKY